MISIRPHLWFGLCGDYTTDANKRAMNAMLQMRKIDITALERAYAGDE